MRHIEFKTCKQCGQKYKWESGGIKASPKDFADMDMCPKCRRKYKLKETIGRVTGNK